MKKSLIVILMGLFLGVNGFSQSNDECVGEVVQHNLSDYDECGEEAGQHKLLNLSIERFIDGLSLERLQSLAPDCAPTKRALTREEQKRRLLKCYLINL